MNRINKLTGVLVILAVTFLAFVLSMTADLSKLELGALINLIWPPLAGGIAILLYLLVAFFSRSAKVRFWIMVLCCVYLLYIGISLHFGKENWPLVLW